MALSCYIGRCLRLGFCIGAVGEADDDQPDGDGGANDEGAAVVPAPGEGVGSLDEEVGVGGGPGVAADDAGEDPVPDGVPAGPLGGAAGLLGAMAPGQGLAGKDCLEV